MFGAVNKWLVNYRSAHQRTSSCWKIVAKLLWLDEQFNQIVGFITAISDGVLSAYIPFLEVFPAYKSKGNGKELNNGMLIRNDGMQSGVSNG